MSTIDRKLVLQVADLANLSLTDEEAIFYQAQLSRIVDYIAQLDAMSDDLGESWRGDVLGGPTPERRDVEQPSLAPDEAVAAAPRRLGTAFQVPRIIE